MCIRDRSISQPQQTITTSGEETELIIHGRHDPIIVPRAVVVVEAMTAITVLDLMMQNMMSRVDGIKKFYKKEV